MTLSRNQLEFMFEYQGVGKPTLKKNHEIKNYTMKVACQDFVKLKSNVAVYYKNQP